MVYTMTPEDDFIFKMSMALLVGAAIIIAIIDRRVKPRKKAVERQRNRILWKFDLNSQNDINEMMNIDKWSITKLWFAGSMISSTITGTTVKRLGKYSVFIGLGIIILWSLFLVFFWYFDVMKKYDNSQSDEDIANEANNITSQTDESLPSNNKDVIDKVFGESSKLSDQRLPLTIITGFLGSGKTTLIKNILNNTIGIRILVIENEIGSEGIDHELLLQQTEQEDIILLNNGCVCCTVRKDLLSTFEKIFANDQLFSKLNWIIIETTGLADPAPLIQTLYMDRQCQSKLRLDSVITLVDVKHFTYQNPGVSASKTASASDESMDKSSVGGLYHKDNTTMEAIQQVIYADRILLNKIDLVSSEELEIIKSNIQSINTQADILTCSFGNVNLDMLLNIRAFDPLKNSLLLNRQLSPTNELVNKKFVIPQDKDGKIPLKNMKLGRNLNISSPLSTISLTADKPLNLNRLNTWIASLLEIKGKDIYRLKGIVDIYGYDEMFVAHGIHMIFDGRKGNKWPEGVKRKSVLVIIGMNLNENQLRNDFLDCL